MLILILNPESFNTEALMLSKVVPRRILNKPALRDEGEQARSTAARHALIYMVWKLYDVEPEQLGIAYDEYGKPYFIELPDIHFSISHCKGLSALTLDCVKVGLDAENIRPFSLKAAKRVCSMKELELIESSLEPERDFFRLWALKESYIKAFREMSCPFREIEFGFAAGQPKSSLANAEFGLCEALDGYVIACCRQVAAAEGNRGEGYYEHVCSF